MATRVGWQRDLTLARRAVLDDLAEFKRRARVTIDVVFDGGAETFFPDGATYRGVRVFYARVNSDADARIKEMVDATRERRTMYVITNDRALGDYVRRSGVRVVRCNDFRRRLDEVATVKRQDERDAKQEETVKGTDEWLRYFGVEPHE